MVPASGACGVGYSTRTASRAVALPQSRLDLAQDRRSGENEPEVGRLSGSGATFWPIMRPISTSVTCSMSSACDTPSMPRKTPECGTGIIVTPDAPGVRRVRGLARRGHCGSRAPPAMYPTAESQGAPAQSADRPCGQFDQDHTVVGETETLRGPGLG